MALFHLQESFICVSNVEFFIFRTRHLKDLTFYSWWQKMEKKHKLFPPLFCFHNSILAQNIFFFSPLKISKTVYIVVIRPKSVSFRLERILLKEMLKMWLGGKWVDGEQILGILFLWQGVSSAASVPFKIIGSQSGHTFSL